MDSLSLIIILIIVIITIISLTLNCLDPCEEFLTIGGSSKPNAWVTLVMKGDDYVPGALVTCQSLHNVGTEHDVICMVTDDVSPEAVKSLSLVSKVIKVPYIKANSIALKTDTQKKLYESWIDVSYTKWNALNLTDYNKVIFIDADQIVLSNCDHLFNLPAPAAMFSLPWVPRDMYKAEKDPHLPITKEEIINGLNDGYVLTATMVVLRPDRKLYYKFTKWLHSNQPYGHKGCINGFDEQSLSEFMMVQGKQFHMVPKEYNYIPWVKSKNQNQNTKPMTIHYHGIPKPWNQERGVWIDTEPWWILASLLVKGYPELSRYFNKQSISMEPIGKCFYHQKLNLSPEGHHTFMNENGKVVCPLLNKN